jgi:hypothetical protein
VTEPTRAELLDQAERCRRLARDITDDFARSALLDLAADMERRAGNGPAEPPALIEIVPT